MLLRLDLFEKIQGIFRDAALHRVNRKAAKFQIEILENKLQSTNETLSLHQEQLSQLHNITKAKKKDYNSKVNNCKHQITTISKHLTEIVRILDSRRGRLFPSIVDNILPIIKDQLDELNGSLEVLNEIIPSLQDSFIVVRNTVPENPPRILLNFNDATSAEAKLKNAILDKNSDTTTISAVASGLGGAGKTCALREVGHLKETIDRFPDGILYTSLGSEATKEDLIRSLAEFVTCSGGEKQGNEIENEKDLKKAIRKAAEWFQGRICLFLIDDIWRCNGIPRGITHMLRSIVSHDESRIAFTTRDQEIDCDISVPFGKKEAVDAEKMLL